MTVEPAWPELQGVERRFGQHKLCGLNLPEGQVIVPQVIVMTKIIMKQLQEGHLVVVPCVVIHHLLSGATGPATR